MRLRNITQEISKYFVLFYSRDWVGGCYMHESCLREKVILPPELLWTSQLRIHFRELKQVRTTTTLKKQSKFEYLKETTDNWLRVAYSMNILWHLKRFKISKRILLAILKSILSNSFHLSVSLRRPGHEIDVKMSRLVLHTRRRAVLKCLCIGISKSIFYSYYNSSIFPTSFSIFVI